MVSFLKKTTMGDVVNAVFAKLFTSKKASDRIVIDQA